MADIFISYAREDRERAMALAEALARHGRSVWWDRKIPAGRRYDEVIAEQLAAARCVIALWSTASVESHWVREEAAEARDRDRLVPALVEAVPPPLGFRSIQAADLTAWSGEEAHPGFQQLLSDVSSLLGEPAPERTATSVTPAAPAETPATAKRTRWAPLALVAIVAALGYGVYAFWASDRTGSGPPPASEPARETAVRPTSTPTDREPGQAFRDCDACPEMVALPAGAFWMGSAPGEAGRFEDEGPRHRVTIPRAFAVSRYEVTFEEYDRFAEATGGRPPSDEGWGRGRRPATNVSWREAKAYAAWLSRETGRSYRLLTEAEWEYACRAGTDTRYAFGDAITERNANFGQNVGRTTEVGSYPPNPWGLHDTHGNVWEWVEDVWHETYGGAPDNGEAWLDGGDANLRVLRGGSWSSDRRDLRSAVRNWGRPDLQDRILGVRVARTL